MSFLSSLKYRFISSFIVSAIMAMIGAYKMVKAGRETASGYFIFALVFMAIGFLYLIIFFKKRNKRD